MNNRKNFTIFAFREIKYSETADYKKNLLNTKL
jgi:hypothetical protein